MVSGGSSISAPVGRPSAGSKADASMGSIAPHQIRAQERIMPIEKQVRSLGMPWEESYGYAQAVRVGDTIWVSGQLSHDDQGNIVGAAPVDKEGRILDHSNMRVQMAQSYANAKKVLAQYGAT